MMANLVTSWRRRGTERQQVERGGTTLPLSLDEWASYFSFNGTGYPFIINGGGAGGQQGEVSDNFSGYVEGIYRRNGVVYACITARQLLFSEARLQFRRLRDGRPGDLFGTSALSVLERPWTNGTTGDLLSRALQDVDLAGNFYAVRRGNAIRRLRPDWVTIVAGSRTGSEVDAEPVGYEYAPGGPGSGEPPEFYLADFVCHWAPSPDPLAKWRGVSWLGPVIGDILGDGALTTHKQQFFNNGANLGYVVTLDPEGRMNPDQFERWVETFKHGHEGALNAYKTLFLSSGADVKVVGTDLKQLDFKQVQGAGETRICAAARVPSIIVGLSEGLESATYSNYAQARRAFADLTMRPLWRTFANAIQPIVDTPPDALLWYDDRDIPFLQEDLKDTAEIQQTQASTIETLIRAGFDPGSAVAAVQNDEWGMLEHTGLVSVQLQKPGSDDTSDDEDPPSLNGGSNGNGQPALPASTS